LQRTALFAGIFATLGVNQFSRFANQESCNGDNYTKTFYLKLSCSPACERPKESKKNTDMYSIVYVFPISYIYDTLACTKYTYTLECIDFDFFETMKNADPVMTDNFKLKTHL
jgi:hypothetical protein